MKRLVCLFCLGLLAVCASAQRKVPVGIDFGVFLPQDTTVKNLFGDAWFRVGLSPLSFQEPQRWIFTFDVAFMNRKNNGHRATLVPVTFGVTRSFASGEDAQPYVAARVGPYYGDVVAPLVAVDSNGFGFNANASVGVNFNQTFYIEARYDLFSDFEGLDFSGFFFNVGFKLFEIRL